MVSVNVNSKVLEAAGLKLLKRLDAMADEATNNAAMERVVDAYIAALPPHIATSSVRNAFYTGLMMGIPYALDGEQKAIEMLPEPESEVPDMK